MYEVSDRHEVSDRRDAEGLDWWGGKTGQRALFLSGLLGICFGCGYSGGVAGVVQRKIRLIENMQLSCNIVIVMGMITIFLGIFSIGI